jgi:UDP-glucose 4-epimerase
LSPESRNCRQTSRGKALYLHLVDPRAGRRFVATQAHPTDCYGRSKLAAESAVCAAGVPFTILRPVIAHGLHAKGNFKRLVRLASKPLPLPFLGLTSQRSFLGIDNFISAVLFVLNHSSTVAETYLVADSTPFTLSEIVTMLRKAQVISRTL